MHEARRRSERARRAGVRAPRPGLRRATGGGRALLARARRRDRPRRAAGLAPTDPAVPGAARAAGRRSAGAGPDRPGAPVASTIGAEAYDFGSFVLRLTKTSVPAGNLTIYFRNYDVSDHNLWVQRPRPSGVPTQISEAVGEGGGATKTVAVTAGTWRFYCSLHGHESMTRDLTVQ